MTNYRERYRERITHVWEHQLTDSHGVKTWERYDPTVQEFIFDQLSNQLFENKKLPLLKTQDTNFDIIFDHETGSHRRRDVKTGSECDMRLIPEVIVDDWNGFKAMVDASKITKLDLRGTVEHFRYIPKINDTDAQEFVNRIKDCKSLRILKLRGNHLTDVFGVALGKAVATHKTLVKLVLSFNKLGEETGVALGEALTTNTSLHTLTLIDNKLREKEELRSFAG